MRSLVGIPDTYDHNSEASSGDLEHFTSVVVGLALSFILDQQKSGETDRSNSGYESASWNELTSRMLVELDSLPANEALVLRKHYFEHMDFAEICVIINLSKGRVAQLHRQALLSLQKRLGRRGHFRLER
jgi:RNA polymerase sigma factor for flagellar operon FliA